MIKLFSLSTIFIILIKLTAIGQNTNNYWYFGSKAGIYFDSLGVHATDGNFNAGEGTASISDGCGLLFYTDGDTVWNKNHQMMENGFDIGGKCAAFHKSSSTQAALVVREPANDSIFFIFTTDCIEDQLLDGLRYSIVNMNLNNGLGKVITKNQQLFAPAEEKLTASKHSDGCDIWIIAHEYGNNTFLSYLLSSSGLSLAPVISSAGQIHNSPNPNYFNARGYLKASPNGQKLINVNPDGAYTWADTTLPEIFSFNQTTGVVTSDFVFPKDTQYWWPEDVSWTIPFYGASFSPDNSKLYLSGSFYGPHLFQYNLNAGSDSAIVASKTLLSYPYPWPAPPLINFPCAIVNAPDGKMYVSHLDRNYLGIINYPNSLGIACGYIDNELSLTNAAMTSWGGLPNFFEDYINPKLIKANFSYTQSASGDSVFFTNNSIAGNSFTWYFGDGSTSSLQNPFHFYTDTGFYTVSLFAKDSLCDVDRICKTIYIPSTTGISETDPGIHLNISPNPFSDELSFKTNSNEKFDLIIFDAFSRKVIYQQFTNSVTIKTGQLSKGIYFFELRNMNGIVTKDKLIKQ